MQRENSTTMVDPRLLLLGGICLGVAGQFLMKYGMNQVGKIDRFGLAVLIHMFSNPFVILGFACYGLSSIGYLMAISNMKLSQAYPMLGIGYVLVMFVSALFLKESVRPVHWLGTLLIFAGVWLVGWR